MGLQEIQRELTAAQAAQARAQVRRLELLGEPTRRPAHPHHLQACPILSLPAEILVVILQFAQAFHDAPLVPLKLGITSALRVHPVLAASLVCRLWHNTIGTAKTLWTSLRIDGERSGAKAVAKAEWWAAKAFGRRQGETEGERRGPGVSRLTLTSVNHLDERTLRLILDALDPADGLGPVPPLTSFTAALFDTAPAFSQEQLNILFHYLTRTSTTSLTSLSLHLPAAHLRIHFSVSRLCNTFTSLSALSLHSASSKSTARDLWLLPRYLPAYEGEDDWPPTALQRLSLVGPIWRLQFQDGTIASPELTREDCPQLEELELGPTSPCMTWDLLGAAGLRRLSLVGVGDAPREVLEPDLTKSAGTLDELKMVRSVALVRRVFEAPAVIAEGLNFSRLTVMDLDGANLTSSIISHLGAQSAPHLERLSLASTTTSTPAGVPLDLPSFPSLSILNLSRSTWVTGSYPIAHLETHAPCLTRLNLAYTAVAGRPLMELARARGDKLVELNLTGCPMMEDTAVVWLKEKLGHGRVAFKLGGEGSVAEERRRWRGVGEW